MTQSPTEAKPLRHRVPGDDDLPLVDRALAGDTQAFEDLVRRHECRVFRTTVALTGNAEDAEEASQDTFLNVYQHLGEFRRDSRFTTWLYRIATHLALNWLRDQKNERSQQRLDETSECAPVREVQDRAPSVEQKLLHQVNVYEVREAVAALPDKQRAAVLMHKYDEMEYSQIAKVLSCSESAVKSLLFRAYETLRVRLAHMA